MYGEYFDIPAPDELIFLSTFTGGEVFRSGCCWRRGKGQGLLLLPGDQEYPVYHHPDIQRVLANAVQWARPDDRAPTSRRRPWSTEPAPRFAAGWSARRCGSMSDAARRRGRPRLGRPAAHGRVRRRCPMSIWSRWPAWRPDQLAELGDQYGIAAGASVRRLAGPGRVTAELDVVSVATPTTLHAPDRGRRPRRRAARARRRSRSPRTATPAETMVDGGRTQRPGARRLVQPPPPR